MEQQTTVASAAPHRCTCMTLKGSTVCVARLPINAKSVGPSPTPRSLAMKRMVVAKGLRNTTLPLPDHPTGAWMTTCAEGGGGEASRLKEYAGWYCRGDLRVRHLRTESSTYGYEGGGLGRGTISTEIISEGEIFATSRNPEACCCLVVGSGWGMSWAGDLSILVIARPTRCRGPGALPGSVHLPHHGCRLSAGHRPATSGGSGIHLRPVHSLGMLHPSPAWAWAWGGEG